VVARRAGLRVLREQAGPELETAAGQ